MREALEYSNSGFKIGGRRVNNVSYADDIFLIVIRYDDTIYYLH